MKARILLISLLLSFYSSFLLGQTNKRANIWYFGYNAGLSFNTGNPTTLTDGALNIWEGCATICDENGNLLFYTDGRYIWNKNHSIMPNAINLGGDNSSSQSGVIVPQPENPNRYFVFSVDAEGGSGGIQYSIVDITLNGGLGGLVSKNNRLLIKASEKLTAIKHCNNKDYWVVAHELDNNSFRAFLITSAGISLTTVESKIGSMQYGGSEAIGYLKASNDGKKIAMCTWYPGIVELLDFNNSNGKLSNVVSIQNSRMRYAYGIEFSPNNQFLYISTAESRIIHQFEVNTTNSANFASSRVEIGEAPLTGAAKIGALQIAPTSLIYVALDGTQFLGVINNPNAKGTACNYVEKGIFLSGKYSGIGLPNLITTYFKEPLSVTTKISTGRNCNDITLSAQIASNLSNLTYQWFLDGKLLTGTNQSSFKPSQSGKYFVSIKETGQCINDSAKSIPIDIFILEVNPKIVNTNCGSVKLQANANSSLKWSGNGIPVNKATQDTLTVYGSGTQIFKVRVVSPIDNTCFIEKEITVNFANVATFSLGKNNIIACDTLTLVAPNNVNWNSYIWSLPDGTTVHSNKILISKSGEYVIAVKNTTLNCQATDKINVTIGATPVIKSDEKLCLSTNSITFDAGVSGNNLTYEWLPGGSTNFNLTVSSAGKYQVKAITSEGCSATRSIEVIQTPIVDLGNDVVTCEGNIIQLKPQTSTLVANTTYLWSTGNTSSSISPQKAGLYILTVNNSICQAIDSVKVTINPLPKIKTDETTCLEKTIEGGGLESNLIYEWQGLGETKPVIEIANEGIYKVKISNQYGCSKTRTITVDGSCNVQIFAPTAFSPNNDGVNDIFKVIVVGGEGIKLDIYNRWGNQLYSEQGLNPNWNGIYQSDVCPNGIYTYILTYRPLRGEVVYEYRGTILIVK